MKLDIWMKKNKITQTKMANDLNVYPGQIHNVLRGRYRPKADFAKKIRDYTQNQVSLDDIYDIPHYSEAPPEEEQKKFNPYISPSEVAELVFEKIKVFLEEQNKMLKND